MKNQQGAPEALRTITRYEVVDCIDSKHVPAVIPNKDGPWVLYEDHLAALVEAQQPAQSAAAAEPLHITHGPLMRHAAALLRSRKPVLPDHESVAAELEMAADGYPTPAGDPSPEWLEVGRIAMLTTPQADSQPAPVQSEREAFERWQTDVLGRSLDELTQGSERPDEYEDVDVHNEWTAWQARAARAPADSVTAPAGWKLVPEEPTDEMLNATYAGQHCSDVYRDMLAASPTPPAQAADSVLEDAALLDWQASARVEVSPEYEGPWHAAVFGEDEKPVFLASGNTPREALIAARKQGGA